MSLVIRNLSDQLVDVVRDRILSGAVLPNSPIRQDTLASELGISKIPLREALARLEQEGLLQSHTNRGFFVRPLSTSEAEEVFAVRLKLEPGIMMLSSARADDAQRAKAREVFESLYHVTEEGGAGIAAFNRAFHLALLRPANQPITLGILERLHVLADRYVRKHLEPLGRDERANEEHRQMLDTWLARDFDSIKQLTIQHLEKTLDDLRQQLEIDGSAEAS